MIPKKSLDSVLDKSIILTITAPNDNAKSISVQCALWKTVLFVSSRAFLLSTPTFLSSTPAENSEATWKKATKCNKSFFLFNTLKNLNSKISLNHVCACHRCEKNSSCIWLKLAMASAAMTVCGLKTEKKLINGTIMYIVHMYIHGTILLWSMIIKCAPKPYD